MKRFVHLVAIVSLIGSAILNLWSAPAALASNVSWRTTISPTLLATETKRVNPADAKLATEFGTKLDLNNANMSAFQAYRGLYPTLAAKIVEGAPYNSPEDVLGLPGLSERQKSRLKKYLDEGAFATTPPAPVYIEGQDRINNGAYK